MLRWTLVGVLGQLAVRAVLGGTVLVLDPSGEAVGRSTDLLDPLPIGDFRLPGLVLLTVFGLGSVATGVAVAQRRPSAWIAGTVVGAGLLCWIGLQWALGSAGLTTALNAATGAAAIALSLHPEIRTPSPPPDAD